MFDKSDKRVWFGIIGAVLDYLFTIVFIASAMLTVLKAFNAPSTLSAKNYIIAFSALVLMLVFRNLIYPSSGGKITATYTPTELLSLVVTGKAFRRD